MKNTPAYLKKGDTIGVICPAGYMALDKIQNCLTTFQNWGYKVKLGNTLGGLSANYFSGTDEQRRIDLQKMLDDREIKAVFCARGGYGLGRIIDQIDFKGFKKHPKWIVGFSDVTILHSHIHARFGIPTLHAPMASAFNEGENQYTESLRHCLEGRFNEYLAIPHDLNKKGKTQGVLVGGNLSLLTHLIGTASDYNTKGKILFLEDLGEYLYNLDRMMYQMKRSGKFQKLAGLIIGGFTDMKDTERPFGKSAYEIIYDLVRGADFPVCFGFPVSHNKENYALKVGASYNLHVERAGVRLWE